MTGQVSKDVDSIQLGDDFVEAITRAVGSCDVVIVLVGDEWLTITDQNGRLRLDDPDDFVRLEVRAALARNVRGHSSPRRQGQNAAHRRTAKIRGEPGTPASPGIQPGPVRIRYQPTGALAAVIVVLDGAPHLYQFQEHWVTYRSTAKALKHERYLCPAKAGPYPNQDRRRQLAERIEDLISQEHAKWTTNQQQIPKHSEGG